MQSSKHRKHLGCRELDKKGLRLHGNSFVFSMWVCCSLKYFSKKKNKCASQYMECKKRQQTKKQKQRVSWDTGVFRCVPLGEVLVLDKPKAVVCVRWCVASPCPSDTHTHTLPSSLFSPHTRWRWSRVMAVTVVLSACGSAWRHLASTSVIFCLPDVANTTLAANCVKKKIKNWICWLFLTSKSIYLPS